MTRRELGILFREAKKKNYNCVICVVPKKGPNRYGLVDRLRSDVQREELAINHTYDESFKLSEIIKAEIVDLSEVVKQLFYLRGKLDKISELVS